jgi:hypothetical protein
MEDVLDLYAEEYDPRYPTVCLDEKLVVLHAESRPSSQWPLGRPERRDYEYVRKGTANLFVLVEPLAGWRHVAVTARRTKSDYAEQLRYLADVVYPQADDIRLVQDNLNTHALAALYEAFPPSQARRLASRLRCITPPSMAVGSTWPRSKSVFSSAAAWRGPSPTWARCASAWMPWKQSAMRLAVPFIGSSPRSRLAPRWPIFIPSKKPNWTEH